MVKEKNHIKLQKISKAKDKRISYKNPAIQYINDFNKIFAQEKERFNYKLAKKSSNKILSALEKHKKWITLPLKSYIEIEKKKRFK